MIVLATFCLLLFCSRCACLLNYELNIYGETKYGYYISVFAGNPPQKIELILDTGSSNLALACVPTSNTLKTYFHYNESTTFKTLSTSVDIHYVEGHWNGFLGKDSIRLLDASDHPIKCMLACMTNIYNIFEANSKFSGVLGLAYAEIAHPDSSIIPFFDQLEQSSYMISIFAFSLCGPFFSDGALATTNCGKLHFGYISTSHYKGEIMYTPIVKERFYEVLLTSLKVGVIDIATDCMTLNKPRVMIDSGSTALHLPNLLYDKTINEIKRNIDQVPQSFWFNETIGCFPMHLNHSTIFPVITISFYHAPRYSFPIHITSELYLLTSNYTVDNFTCFELGIHMSNSGTIIGSNILRGFYVIFDRADKRIGFANSTSWNAWNNSTSFAGTPYFSVYATVDNCQPEDYDNNSINAGVIVLLIIALLLTFLLLCTMITWIRRYIIKRSEYHSDTSSLVGDDLDSMYSY